MCWVSRENAWHCFYPNYFLKSVFWLQLGTCNTYIVWRTVISILLPRHTHINDCVVLMRRGNDNTHIPEAATKCRVEARTNDESGCSGQHTATHGEEQSRLAMSEGEERKTNDQISLTLGRMMKQKEEDLRRSSRMRECTNHAGSTHDFRALDQKVTSRLHHSALSSTPYRKKVWAMVDGEFTGPMFQKHAVLSWSVVLFHVPNIHFDRFGNAHRPSHVLDLVIDATCIRMFPPNDAVMDEDTFKHFWSLKANEKLVQWLSGDNSVYTPMKKEWVAPDVMTPSQGARHLAEFLRRHSMVYDIRFVAKPASIDIPRLQFFLHSHAQDDVRFHHSSACLLSMLRTMGNMLPTFTEHLRNNRLRYHRSETPSHFPLEDCLDQIIDFEYAHFVTKLECWGRRFMFPNPGRRQH